MPGPQSARERFQDTLVRLSRRSRRMPATSSSARQRAAGGGGRPVSGEGAVRAGAALPVARVEPAEGLTGPTGEIAAELLERLDRIEERLADLQRPLRPIPASREIFGEWVRLRRWEEISFGDFLKLRRSGLV